MKEYKKNIRDGFIILFVGIILFLIFIILLITKSNEKTISDIMISGILGQTFIIIGLIKVLINSNKMKNIKEE
ncbi:MAG: hypothetical protein J5970_01870 [Bacilli bacterium]|nr:hypothetical protein [Bacilli bacterium]